MKAIVTCGPGCEPIDQVRRITNFSTGELGVQLCNGLVRAGVEVLCFKGSGATCPGPEEQCQLDLFEANDDLLGLLTRASATQEIAVVFHAAALCDYKVQRVEDQHGQKCDSPKIASRSGALTIHLEPATKVISQMRALFPESLLVGWKYELTGTRTDALAKAERQIAENQVDACVVNGRAFGSGFGLCQPRRPLSEFTGKSQLVAGLVDWLRVIQPGHGLCVG
jgi:phosphopantothenoylcysteine synthetase/decarboxylase